MLSQEKIQRINALSQKKKAGTLTEAEQSERAALHQEYIAALRGSMKKQIEGIKVVDKEGTDITPAKVKEIQRQKGLHGRSFDE